MILLDPIRSLVDFPFYKEARNHSTLRCLGYLAYLGLLFSGFVSAFIFLTVRPSIRQAGEWMASSLPTITIVDGKASSDPAKPVVVHPPREEKLAILIDTSRTQPFTFEEMTSRSLMIAVTQDAVYVALLDRGRMERRPFADMKLTKPLTIGPEFYRRAADLIIKAVFIFALPLFWFFFLFWKLAAGLAYSFIGFLINEGSGAGLDFAAIYKIALYAQTPWIFLQALMLPMKRPLPFALHVLIGFLLTSTYLWKAISTARETPPA